MSLPPSIEIRQEPGITRLVLPVRTRNGAAIVAPMLIFFGLFATGFALFWISGVLGMHDRGRANPPAPAAPAVRGPEAVGPRAAPAAQKQPAGRVALDGFRIVMALFGVPFVIAGLVPIGLGLLILFPSHGELVISQEQLICIEKVGPLRFRRRRKLAELKVIRVGALVENSRNAGDQRPDYAIFGQRSASADDAEAAAPYRLLRGYPRELLLPLAEFLVEEIKQRGFATVVAMADPEPAGVSKPLAARAAPVEAALPQPQSSKIGFVPAADSITLIVPRTGFRGLAGFLLLFSAVWNLLAIPFFGFTLVELVREPTLDHLGKLGFLAIFAAVGTSTLLAALQFALRKSVLLATRDSLVFTQTGPFHKSEFQFAGREIASIGCENSNTTVNGQVLKQLSIASELPTSTVRHLLVGRDEAELRWIASVLRSFYALASAD